MASLEEAIDRHLAAPADAGTAAEPAADALRRASFSSILRRGVDLNPEERPFLLAFLRSLEDDQAGSRALIVPERVPSGLPVPALATGR